jgi:hypothetical protein
MEFSFTNRADAIYTKAELVVDDDGRPQHLPWEDWRPGEDEHISAWMRATSPSGSAAYEGQVQWSGELGYGVRAPESGQSGKRQGVTRMLPLREVLTLHLDDDQRTPRERGVQGALRRLRHRVELQRQLLSRRGRAGEP